MRQFPQILSIFIEIPHIGECANAQTTVTSLHHHHHHHHHQPDHHHFWPSPQTVVSTCSQQPPEWTILSHIDCSVNVRLWDSRSFRTVFIHVIRRRLDSLFQSSDGNAVKIFLVSGLGLHARVQLNAIE